MKMYWFHEDDLTGNFPVWSLYNLLVVSILIREHMIACVLLLPGSWGADISSPMGVAVVLVVGAATSLVECMLHWSWSRWHLEELMLSGRYLVIKEGIRPSHEENLPLLMVRINVDGTGLKHVTACNLAKSFFIWSRRSTPFATFGPEEEVSGEVEGSSDGGGVVGIDFLDEIGMSHNPMSFRGPVIITLLF